MNGKQIVVPLLLKNVKIKIAFYWPHFQTTRIERFFFNAPVMLHHSKAILGKGCSSRGCCAHTPHTTLSLCLIYNGVSSAKQKQSLAGQQRDYGHELVVVLLLLFARVRNDKTGCKRTTSQNTSILEGMDGNVRVSASFWLDVYNNLGPFQGRSIDIQCQPA